MEMRPCSVSSEAALGNGDALLGLGCLDKLAKPGGEPCSFPSCSVALLFPAAPPLQLTAIPFLLSFCSQRFAACSSPCKIPALLFPHIRVALLFPVCLLPQGLQQKPFPTVTFLPYLSPPMPKAALTSRRDGWQRRLLMCKQHTNWEAVRNESPLIHYNSCG